MNNTPKAVIGLAVALLVGVSVLVAQQPVTVANAAYDPCADPAKVVTLVLNAGAAAGDTELVAADGVKRIYLCSAKVQGGSAGTLSMQFGTGTACATGTDYLDLFTITAADVPVNELAPRSVTSTFMRSDTAHALCITRSVSMTARGHVRYVQE